MKQTPVKLPEPQDKLHEGNSVSIGTSTSLELPSSCAVIPRFPTSLAITPPAVIESFVLLSVTPYPYSCKSLSKTQWSPGFRDDSVVRSTVCSFRRFTLNFLHLHLGTQCVMSLQGIQCLLGLLALGTHMVHRHTCR